MATGSNRVLASLVAVLVLALALPGTPLRPTAAQAQGDEAKAKELARKLLAAGDKLMKQGDGLKRWYLSAIDELAQSGMVGVSSIHGLSWCEVDDAIDLAFAEKLVRTWPIQPGKAILLHCFHKFSVNSHPEFTVLPSTGYLSWSARAIKPSLSK